MNLGHYTYNDIVVNYYHDHLYLDYACIVNDISNTPIHLMTSISMTKLLINSIFMLVTDINSNAMNDSINSVVELIKSKNVVEKLLFHQFILKNCWIDLNNPNNSIFYYFLEILIRNAPDAIRLQSLWSIHWINALLFLFYFGVLILTVYSFVAMITQVVLLPIIFEFQCWIEINFISIPNANIPRAQVFSIQREQSINKFIYLVH